MDSDAWDERYASTELVWSAGPNVFVEDRTAGLAPGRALDVAAGEGRNAVWLAEQGWDVTAVDFSPVGVETGRKVARRRGVDVDWRVQDATRWQPDPQAFDLVLVIYLQLPGDERRAAHRLAASAVTPGGTLLVVGHDRDNLEHGIGGPPDPALLLTADEVVSDLEGTGLVVREAGQVTRPVPDPDGGTAHAIDCLVRADRPAG